MSGLCGWLNFGGEPAEDRALAAAMAAPLARFDGSTVTIAAGPGQALACAGGSIHEEGGKLAAVTGAMRFADAGLQRRADAQGSARVFAELYRQQGEVAFGQLSGAFAAAFVDRESGTALLAVDRAGIYPLIYALAGNALVFGSTSDAVNRHPGVRRELDPQSLYNYVYFHMVPGPGTAFVGQTRLLPGEYLTFPNGSATVKRYWEMQFREDRPRPFAELKERFVDTLRSSVRDMADGHRVGAFLSGGTDSSTLSGLLGEVTGEPARTYSIGFDAQGYDEMEYARLAARHFKTQHHEYYVTPDDVVQAIPRLGEIYDQPFGNSSAVPTYYCARMAKADGVERLLGGDGGDELFGGNERYAKQYVLSLYGSVPGLLRKSLVEPLAYLAPGAVPLVRKARSYIEQASVPMPARLETYNLLGRFGAERVFHDDFLAGVETGRPLALLDDVYRNARAHSLINRMLALDLKFTLADNDLPKVSRTCELAGVDVAFPMMDERVVEFSAELEPQLKLKGTKLRWFFKEALRDFLPHEIIVKQKHGFGLPFGPWLQIHKPLQELVHDSLAGLKSRRIVRAEFLDELSDHVATHPGYYGTMVWVLMMLEQWFRHHGDEAAA